VPAKSGNTGVAQTIRNLQAYYLLTENIRCWGEGGNKTTLQNIFTFTLEPDALLCRILVENPQEMRRPTPSIHERARKRTSIEAKGKHFEH